MSETNDNDQGLDIKKTEIPELDRILHGGIPKGHVVLLAGNSGCGKTVLSMQWLFNGFKKLGEPGVYITLTEPVNVSVKNAKTLSFYDSSSNVKFIDLRAAANLFELSGKKITMEDASNIADVILNLVTESKAKRVVIDSVTAIVYLLNDKDLIRHFIFKLGATLSKLDCTTILISEVTGENVSAYGVEEFISDGIIKLNYTKVKNEVKRSIQIVKLRGTSFNPNIHNYKIDNHGINIFSDICVDLEYESSKERTSTGNEALDKLLQGGLFKGSSTLITGSTGTGKSSLAAQFMMEGLRHGEPCLYLGFEESREQLIRNAQGYGWNLEEHEKKELLTFRCIYPKKKPLEEHLADIKFFVEKTKAQRCSVDSLSAIANSFPEEDFLSFVVELNGYLKSKKVTSFFIVATATLMGSDTLTGNNVSSITDNIIMLRYIEVQGNLKSMINILKMRGSAHSKDLRSYEITNSGIIIGQSLSGYEGIMTGVTRKVSATVDEKIETEFRRFIGPMGAPIFLEIKAKGLNKNNILEYISDLLSQGILKQDDAANFKNQVSLIFDSSSFDNNQNQQPVQNWLGAKAYSNQNSTDKKKNFMDRIFGGP